MILDSDILQSCENGEGSDQYSNNHHENDYLPHHLSVKANMSVLPNYVRWLCSFIEVERPPDEIPFRSQLAKNIPLGFDVAGPLITLLSFEGDEGSDGSCQVFQLLFF